MATRHEFLVVIDGLELTPLERARIETAVQDGAARALADLNIAAARSPLQDEISERAFEGGASGGHRRPPTLGIVFRPPVVR